MGLSGGVDSSVAALLLKQQGYEVIGVYMKNWTQDLPGLKCPWREDFNDAKRVAVQLGIEFKVYDFQKEYKHKVVDYMLREYKAGRTPNPDIMCNQEIKFGLFLETALEDGADLIATGHYAKTKNGQLLMAKDQNKDQTYFLYRASKTALQKTLYPIGDYLKSEVRTMAAKHKLVTADKDESMGLCFVGKVSLKDFLKPHIQEKQGDIILVGFSAKGMKRGGREESVIGKHQGVHLFTFGQRHGISVGGKEPYFVCDKNVRKNILYVARRKDLPRFFPAQISLRNFSLINSTGVKFPLMCSVRYRYRQSLQKAVVISSDVASWSPDPKRRGRKASGVQVIFEKPAVGITPGQSIVFYKGKQMLGGGIIKQIPRANCARDKGRL